MRAAVAEDAVEVAAARQPAALSTARSSRRGRGARRRARDRCSLIATESGACGPWRGGGGSPRARSGCASGRGTRGYEPACASSAARCASSDRPVYRRRSVDRPPRHGRAPRLCFRANCGVGRGRPAGRLYGRARCPPTTQRTISTQLWAAVREELRAVAPGVHLQPLARAAARRSRRRARPSSSPPRPRSAPGSSAATPTGSLGAVARRAPRAHARSPSSTRPQAGGAGPASRPPRVAAARPQPHLRALRDRPRQPARPRRGARGRRAARRGLQPALPPRSARPRQDPPARRDRRVPASQPPRVRGPLHDRRAVHRPSSSPRCGARARRRSRRATASSTRC